MSYLDKFTRGERRLTIEELKWYSESIRRAEKDGEASKLRNLFRDCFGPHVSYYFNAPHNRLQLSNQVDRIIAADNITSVFLSNHYKPPKVIESISFENAAPGFTIDEFKARITSNPIDNYHDNNLELGTNKITYLIGDVGVGKSTYISRLLMDFADRPMTDEDGYRVIPIVYDFEVRHKNGAQLKKIDEHFYADLYSLIYRTISGQIDIKDIANLDQIAINPVCPGGDIHRDLVYYLQRMIHHLAKSNIRLFIIFDNIDRYHFRYTKYSFIGDYAHEQFESVKSNISELVNMLDKKDLWASGLCILIVCRRYLYEYLSNFDDVAPKDNHFGVFQLPRASSMDVVSSRLNLFESAIRTLDNAVKAAKTSAFQEYLEHLRGLITVEDTAKLHRSVESPSLNALTRLGHNGYRSLVKFIASLALSYKDADAIKRLLVDHPHLLVLLYIANNHQRYTQDQLHFPNIYLCDCVVSPNKDFPQAHKSHRHTYWLKYLLLKYLAHRENQKDFCSAEDIIEVFSMKGGYEIDLVKVALGSLCTTGEFGCIQIDYSATHSVQDCRLTLTERGRYLISYDHKLFGGGNPVEFCFNFHYLQLMVDDKLLAHPKQYFNMVFRESKDVQYGYLYLSNSEYNTKAPHIVTSKIESVLYFVRIIEACLDHETSKMPALFMLLNKLNLIPDFRQINHELLTTAERLLQALNRAGETSKYIDLERTLRYDKSYDEFFQNLTDQDLMVKK